MGDLNGDGVVNADDYALIDGGFANHASGYGNGDVDYSGAINSDDYFYIDLGFANQGTQLAAPQAAESGTLIATKKLISHHKRHRKHHATPRLFLHRVT